MPLNFKDDQLPYTFDLLWDIKTKTRLVEKYIQAIRDIRDIKEVCESHDMNIDDIIEQVKR